MFFKKRGQAALEFLMTYAWAILVVIIIIGALAYFGVLNPDTLVPDKCTFSTGLACKDFSYSYDSTGHTGNITLRITNGLGQTINVNDLSFTSEQLTNNGANCKITYSPVITIENGNTGTLNVTGGDCYPLDLGRKLRLKGKITYSFTATGSLPHTVDGELFTKPVPQ